MDNRRIRISRWNPLRALVLGGATLALVFAACGDGEDRPGVEVLDGDGSGSASGSVSASGPGSGSVSGSVSASGPASGTASDPGEAYAPVSDVEAHAALALDARDIAALMAPATEGNPVDWAAVEEIYVDGKNSFSGDGSARTLQGTATDEAVLAQFPGGATVYGDASFLDAHVRAGIDGTGRGAGLSDNARRQLVEKGISSILYGKVLQELDAARVKIEDGNTEDAGGAPHNVDEAWAFYAGAADADGTRPFSLASTAGKREADFGLEGTIDQPLQQALSTAQAAAREGDLAAFDAATADVEGHLNAIFYLASLKYAKSAADDTEQPARQTHLAEGWAFYQTIRAAVADGSAEAAARVEEVYTADAASPVTGEQVAAVYAALNDPAVLESLGVPAAVRVASPLA